MTLPAEQPVRRAAGSVTSHWPGDVVLVAIIRDGHARPPDPDGSLEAGDELLFVTARTSSRSWPTCCPRGTGTIAVSKTATPRVQTI